MIKRILTVALIGAALYGTTGCQSGDSSFKNYKGLSYKIVRHGKGKKAMMNDFVEFELIAKCDTNNLANSWKDPKAPIFPVQETRNPGEWQAVLQVLSAGDSAVVEISCDTLLKNIPPNQMGSLPPWLKKGNKITLNVSVLSVMNAEENKKKQEEKAAQQLIQDDKALQDYFAKNNLKPTKTASGLYYTIASEGTGAAIAKGQEVTMNYTGKLMSGQTFDSNEDSNFHHKMPFTFPVGMHQVIPGWDEGVLLMKKGTKGTLYVPSSLAYGAQSPSPTIPPNSNLIFTVEVTDVKEGKAPQGGPQAQMEPVK